VHLKRFILIKWINIHAPIALGIKKERRDEEGQKIYTEIYNM